MAKRIVVCSDGTGNTAIKGRGTNVFKLFEAVDLESHRADAAKTPQIAIYDDGVGTQNFKPLKIVAGATGWGLSRNVKHLYKELARVYDPGDEIFMFGFSRGAFTVRTLAGLIASCGLLDQSKLDVKTFAGLERSVDDAYKVYRKCYRPLLWQVFGAPTRSAAAEFRRRCSHDYDVKIRFLGVWDTVDAVGVPFFIGDFINAAIYRFKFPDLYLSPIVERACQALAIDDQRASFRPLVWHQRPDDQHRIEQVWFAGAHSNVGGGYPKQGMSLVALDWMLSHAQRAGMHRGEDGLRLNPADRESFRSHASSDDKLYDPRAGLGLFYRWKIRDIAELCAEHSVPIKLHITVLERLAHGTDDYAPGNLPSTAQVVITDPVDTNRADELGTRDAAALVRLRAINTQNVLRTIEPVSLLDTVRAPMMVGQLSYYLYLFACLMAIIDAARIVSPNWTDYRPWPTAGAVLVLLWNVTLNPSATLAKVGPALWMNPRPFVIVAAGLATAMMLSLRVDAHLSSKFSAIWYARQKDLREGLKAARTAIASGSVK
jgi:uncharacterized protein (DUF2235 family)